VLQKLAANCALNPASALVGCLNDDFVGSDWGRSLVMGVCRWAREEGGDQEKDGPQPGTCRRAPEEAGPSWH
jgi:hypothetical protein